MMDDNTIRQSPYLGQRSLQCVDKNLLKFLHLNGKFIYRIFSSSVLFRNLSDGCLFGGPLLLLVGPLRCSSTVFVPVPTPSQHQSVQLKLAKLRHVTGDGTATGQSLSLQTFECPYLGDQSEAAAEESRWTVDEKDYHRI